jgi:hypothetical protein
MHKLNIEQTLDEEQTVSQNQNSETSKQANLHQLDLDKPTEEDMTKKSKKLLVIISLLAIVAGTATGFGGYKLQNKTSANKEPEKEPVERIAEGTIQKGETFGINDPDTFKDTATGYLEKGGIEGEGSHQLLREGGPSRTVYLTSSVTDLDKLVGMEVKIWGETNKGQKAAWLMDVGLVEVLNTEAEPPFEQEL